MAVAGARAAAWRVLRRSGEAGLHTAEAHAEAARAAAKGGGGAKSLARKLWEGNLAAKEPTAAPDTPLAAAMAVAWPGTLAVSVAANASAAGGVGTLVLPRPLDGPPRVFGVRLVGELEGWVDGYDVGIAVARSVPSSCDVVEFHGPGTESLSVADAMAMCYVASNSNTAALFPPTERIVRGWGNMRDDDVAEAVAVGRAAAEEEAPRAWAPDDGVAYDAGETEIDLSATEPSICLADDPACSWTLSAFAQGDADLPWGAGTGLRMTGAADGDATDDDDRDDSLHDFAIGVPSHLGTHTDVRRAAHIASQATKRGLCFCTPSVSLVLGSPDEAKVARRRRYVEDLEKAGAVVREPSQLAATTKRLRPSFRAAADGTGLFANPQVTACLALAGDLAFDPRAHRLSDENGDAFELTSTSHGGDDA